MEALILTMIGVGINAESPETDAQKSAASGKNDPFETLIKKPPQMRWLYLCQARWNNLWGNCL